MLDQFAHCRIVVEDEMRFLHFKVREEMSDAISAIKRAADDMVET